MTKGWHKFPHGDARYVPDAAALKKAWSRLHRGDCEAMPRDPAMQEAWRLFHAGEFGSAVAHGRKAGGSGVNAAVKAQVVYAHYLEHGDKAKLGLFEEAAGWADARRKEAVQDANAHYLYAFALGRYAQGISVAKALAQGFGGKVKDALSTALSLEPKHAEAHTALGAYHAEVIGKVGALVGGMTYGAKKDTALEHFRTALKLFPESPIAHVEYANGLLLLFGKAEMKQAEGLYRKAAAARPADAMEHLDVDHAREELA